jgi:hypothetical protein
MTALYQPGVALGVPAQDPRICSCALKKFPRFQGLELQGTIVPVSNYFSSQMREPNVCTLAPRQY